MQRFLFLLSAACLIGCGSSSSDTDPSTLPSQDAAPDTIHPDADASTDTSIDTSPDAKLDAIDAAAEDALEEPALQCPDPNPDPNAKTEVLADLSADLKNQNRFYDFPFPSDLRLTSAGTPEIAGFPHSLLNKVVADLLLLVPERKFFPVIPVAWFRFTDALPDLENASDNVIPAEPSSSVLLIDTDENSPDRGKLYPTVVSTPKPDGLYVPANLLTVAARPGFILAPGRKYAFLVMRSFKDGAGRQLKPAATMETLLKGEVPVDAKGQAAHQLYMPLIDTLTASGICPNQVAAATVFTTGDQVQATEKLSSDVMKQYSITIDSLALDPDDGATHERYCELHATVTYPQFQEGKPPFNTYGRFDMGTSGLPKWQRDEQAPIVLTIPKQPMPAGGYPLLVYFHGSGGRSGAVVDRGVWHHETDANNCPDHALDTWDGKTGCNTKGLGPAHYHSFHGFATAGSALPLNPERYPGAKETEYLNLLNLSAFRDTFRQGIIEQRLFIQALRELQIPPSALAGCTGPSLPAGETAYHFQEAPVLAQGQSMGGMYTNTVGAVEPRIQAVIPTGAGGYWSYFILKGNQVPGGATTLSLVLGTKGTLTFMHPAMHLLELAWEAAEPIVYMPRLAHRPLPGHPVRAIYEPVGQGDSYFPTPVYDAVSLAYGHRQAGDPIWPEMQDALKLGGLEGILPYPVKQDVKSVQGGAPYTGVIVQYAGDGIYDPHAIYTQLDAVKYQYGCFAATFLKNGVATVPAPAPLGTPCPE
ncbi:MAG: hypothetical protein HY898_02785 [Deltaproteobacteria bacterium]|nr:hypothetical protein [Deltaproteobacteria bacterium]